MMLFYSTVVVPTIIIAANEQCLLQDSSKHSQGRQNRGLPQNFGPTKVSASNSFLSSWQKIDYMQPMKQEDQESEGIMMTAQRSRDPTITIRSHPTQSDLVQRFASIFTPLSMSTSVVACDAEEQQSFEATPWGRWGFN
ncbi:unnamed protein product [Cylindrotheca closterium]|uniref:Uncharacterized protein n=1 Tax=Cylindrotheca closterium TaxID=2856 RepID=A0AAD2FN59_9STRA|nr:unnamed protein product [Cylindrotheca closterium]